MSNESANRNASPYEEGALKVQKLTPMEVIFTVVGCGVGSGCLGTAYGARLAGFPVSVGLLSRFVTKKTLDATLKRASDGSVDSACWMRFCTFTNAMSAFVPVLNVTVRE